MEKDGRVEYRGADSCPLGFWRQQESGGNQATYLKTYVPHTPSVADMVSMGVDRALRLSDDALLTLSLSLARSLWVLTVPKVSVLQLLVFSCLMV